MSVLATESQHRVKGVVLKELSRDSAIGDGTGATTSYPNTLCMAVLKNLEDFHYLARMMKGGQGRGMRGREKGDSATMSAAPSTGRMTEQIAHHGYRARPTMWFMGGMAASS